MEEDIWKQRAKVKWELEGDRNTKYFHAVATASRRKQVVNQVEYQGTLYCDQQTKARVFFKYYAEFMGKESTAIPNIHWPSLYEEQHELQELVLPISLDEIRMAVKSWPNNKSPGPECFTGEFYKTILETILLDLCLRNRHNIWTTLAPINSSHIVLLPKKSDACQPQDYHPISLIHGVQKIFSKIWQRDWKTELQCLYTQCRQGF